MYLYYNVCVMLLCFGTAVKIDLNFFIFSSKYFLKMVMEHLFWVRAEAMEQNVCGVGLEAIIFYTLFCFLVCLSFQLIHLNS